MSICFKCASLGPTCCCRERDILVTRGDIERISRFVGYIDFFEYRVPVDPEYLAQDDDPNWLKYTVREDGSRQVLKRSPVGGCLFLTEIGCHLSLDVRPLVCRLYPFQYTEQGITGVLSECPIHLLTEGETILDALHMSYEEAQQWWQLLYTELCAQGEYLHENRNNI